jgi:uncharacterized protein (DUF2147 family)
MTGKWITAAGLIMFAATSAQAASPQGDWSRGDGKAKVRIAPCGEDICATNTWIRPGTKDEKTGDRLVMTIADQGDGKWTGKAYDPQRKLHYRLKMRVAEKTMTTTGCVLGGLICKGVDWTRIDG